ncbi:MAG: small basic family protein [Candidatus Eremiobacteraeota bacterium]|nr:small basic family protein [Candidatus Eremiobacteraeota bacterium]
MWVVVGLLLGVIVGLVMPFQIPVAISKYVSVAFLGGLDSVLGGTRAGLEHRFDLWVFSTGFFTNIILAVLVTWVGQVLGADLYLAAVVTFGFRIFANLGPIRRHLIGRPAAAQSVLP